MTTVLTILSVVAMWAFLTVLVVGLLLVFKVLESVRASLRRIAMGVRAIEQQTKPLGAHASALAETLSRAGVVSEAAPAVSAAAAALDTRS
jgi:hypothetical protein